MEEEEKMTTAELLEYWQMCVIEHEKDVKIGYNLNDQWWIMKSMRRLQNAIEKVAIYKRMERLRKIQLIK